MHPRNSAAAVSRDEVIRTEELFRRPARAPDFAAENQALTELAQVLAADPRALLQQLADSALRLCRADSAGVSILTDDGSTFHWPAIAGAFAMHVGEGLARAASPCGVVVQCDDAVLVQRPERHFTNMQDVRPAITEAVLVPFHVDGRAAGTLWAIAHSPERRFDAEDVRVLRSLAGFAAAGYHFTRALQVERERAALAENVAQRTRELDRSRAETAAQASARERAERTLLTELARRQRVHEAATRLTPEGDVEVLYGEILSAALAVTGADMGNLQLIDPDSGELVMLRSIGFDDAFKSHFARTRFRPDAQCTEAVRRGTRVIVADLAQRQHDDPTTSRQVMLDAGVRAFQSTPLVSRAGHTLGLISTHWRAPHEPAQADFDALDVLARQAADLIDRHRAHTALRDSEARYRRLFELIDEAFFIAEVLFDAAGKPCDYRFLEVNPAFERHSGLPGATGRSIQEMAPGIERHWLETYGRVAMTGKPERFVRESAVLNRWYDAYAFRVGEPGQRRVAVLFTDVTERVRRERREAFLAEIHAEFALLGQPEEILHTAGERLGRFLDVTSVSFAEVDSAAEYATVIYDRRTGGPTAYGRHRLAGYLSAEYIAALRAGRAMAINDTTTDPHTAAYATAYMAHEVRAQVHAPYLSGGRWKFLLTVQCAAQREWSAEEVSLLRELSALIWLRLERARAEEALRESERQYRTLFHSIDQGFCVLEVLLDDRDRPYDYRFIEINPMFEAHTGLREPVGRTARELVPDLDDSWVGTYGHVALTGESMRFENHAPAMGRWFDVFAFRVGNPTQRRVALLFKDITESKAAEDALRRSETHFRRLADTAPAMLWLLDPEGYCTFVSRGWTEYTGQAVDEALGGGWSDCIHPEDRDAALAHVHAAMARVEPFAIDYRLRGRDGQYRWCNDSGRPRYHQSGRYEGFIGTVIDVHERKQAEQSLREADRRKDEFLATLAHELRNPLAPLRNSLDIMRLRGKGGADPLMAVMERQVNHLTRLVDDLLEISRISRGRIELRRERVELSDVLRNAIEASMPVIEAGHHALKVHLPPQPIPLEADAVRLAQVFGNLLNNAAKYTDPRGTIDLSVALREDAVEVRVRDTGIGIAADQIDRVFEMFSQVDQSAGRAHGGLGIGLSLVRTLVRMHGGDVAARSGGRGQGSEFIVRLPLAAARVAPDTQQTDEAQAALDSPRRVLVADDNRDAADSLGVLLELIGAQPHVVYDGPAALEAFAAFAPDAVLLDIGMPGMDGHEVAQRLRAQPGGDQVTLIALTGWGQEEDRRRTREAGFDHHLLKPVSMDELSALLARD